MEQGMEFTELLQRTADVARGAGGLVLAIKKPEVFTKEGHSIFVTEADLASHTNVHFSLHPWRKWLARSLLP